MLCNLSKGDGGDGISGDGAHIPGRSAAEELCLCLLQQRRLGKKVDDRGAEHLARVDGGLVADGRTVAGDVLPAVAGTAVGPGRHFDLGGGALPAHVAYIGGAGTEHVSLIQGQQEAVHGVSRFTAQLRGALGVVAVVLAADAGYGVAAGIGGGQSVGKGQLLLGVIGHAQGLEVFMEHPLQGVVGDGVRQSVDKQLFVGGLRHKGGRRFPL